MNRTQRRAMKRNAPKLAAILSETCLDYYGGKLEPITDRPAVAALRLAYRRMLEAGGKPMAVPISEEAAMGFPVRKAKPMPGAAHWLAVGIDVAGHATCTLESAIADCRAVAHDAARDRALARLQRECSFGGYSTASTGAGQPRTE